MRLSELEHLLKSLLARGLAPAKHLFGGGPLFFFPNS